MGAASLIPKGVVAVLTGPDGSVWASAADFSLSGYGGFTLRRAQEIRAKAAMNIDFVRNIFPPVVISAMAQYDTEKLVGRLKGFKETIIPIGHEAED